MDRYEFEQTMNFIIIHKITLIVCESTRTSFNFSLVNLLYRPHNFTVELRL